MQSTKQAPKFLPSPRPSRRTKPLSLAGALRLMRRTKGYLSGASTGNIHAVYVYARLKLIGRYEVDPMSYRELTIAEVRR